MEALVASSTRLSEATDHIGRSAFSVESLATGIDRVSTVFPQMGERVQAVDGQLERMCATIASIEKELQALPRPAEKAVALTDDLTDAVNKLHQLLTKANLETGVLNGSTAQTLEYLERSKKLAADAEGMEASAKVVNTPLNSIADSASRTASTLSMTSTTLETAVAAATRALERDLQTSSRAASLFTERLTEVAQSIIDETRKVR